MKKVSLTIICRDQESAEYYANELQNTDAAQNSLFCWGLSLGDCTKAEEREVLKELPEEALETL